MVDFYKSNREFTKGSELPMISKNLDSVRAYQFEVKFIGVQGRLGGLATEDDLTLAAKQVSPVGYTVDDIEARRVNDKTYYPGQVTQEEITITFDNLLSSDVVKAIWEWFKTTYNPDTGELGPYKLPEMAISQLEHDGSLRSQTRLFGVYPKAYKLAEFNYSTNEFHTIEVTFRYDFMDQSAKS